jgi:hypothetical protein
MTRAYRLATNVAPGGTGNFTFTFNYASKLTLQPPSGVGAWNAYPLAAPTASGLPYAVVGEQSGVTP